MMRESLAQVFMTRLIISIAAAAAAAVQSHSSERTAHPSPKAFASHAKLLTPDWKL